MPNDMVDDHLADRTDEPKRHVCGKRPALYHSSHPYKYSMCKRCKDEQVMIDSLNAMSGLTQSIAAGLLSDCSIDLCESAQPQH